MSDHKDFFAEHGLREVRAWASLDYGTFTVEEMYQAFKARAIAELSEAASEAIKQSRFDVPVNLL